MKRLAQSVVAVAFGALIVTASVIGGVMMTNPNVHTVEEASDSVVQRGEGQVLTTGAAIVGIAAGKYIYDNYISDSPKTEDLQQADALETKKELYRQANIQRQNSELTSTAYSNYLQETGSIALMEGKNAYIRALENGESKSSAEVAAREAIKDYYSVKEENVVKAWSTSAILINSMRTTANNTSGVSADFVTFGGDTVTTDGLESQNGTYTLVNNETIQFTELVMTDGTGASHTFDLQSRDPSGYSMGDFGTKSFDNGNYDPVVVVNHTDLYDRTQEIASQQQQVQDEVETFINGTYDSYQQGDINASDLVDPYLGSMEYSAENSSQFQDWALRSLSSMGLNSPENLSNIGRMTVVAGSQSYDGILMSDGQPEGGFTVGETYDAGNISGLQFVALDGGGTKELEGEFTLETAETADGQTLEENETIVYKNVTRSTANTTEYKALMEELDSLTAEINARQQKLRNSGGGGLLPDFGLGGVGAPVALIAAGAVVFLLGRN